MRVASGLFSWGMVAGLLALSSRQYTPTVNRGPLSASHQFCFLSKRRGRRMPPAERSASYIIIRSRYISKWLFSCTGLYRQVPLLATCARYTSVLGAFGTWCRYVPVYHYCSCASVRDTRSSQQQYATRINSTAARSSILLVPRGTSYRVHTVQGKLWGARLHVAHTQWFGYNAIWWAGVPRPARTGAVYMYSQYCRINGSLLATTAVPSICCLTPDLFTYEVPCRLYFVPGIEWNLVCNEEQDNPTSCCRHLYSAVE